MADSNRQDFDCAPWVHKAIDLTTEEFRREVEKHLTGQDTEPWEIMHFKVYESQLPVIEQALETAALMLCSDKSRGYCLEMICVDFLAGFYVESGDSKALRLALGRLFGLLPFTDQEEFLDGPKRTRILINARGFASIEKHILCCIDQYWDETHGNAKTAVRGWG